MSTVQQIIVPAGSKSPSSTAPATTTQPLPADDGTTVTPTEPPTTRMLLPTAFLIPNADGSTQLAHLVPVSQPSDGIQNIFINSLVSSKNTAIGSNNLMGMLATSPISTLGNMKIITTSAPVGAKFSITPTIAPVIAKTSTTPAATDQTSTSKAVESSQGTPLPQPQMGSITIPSKIITKLGSDIAASMKQFKKIKPIGGDQQESPFAGKIKTYPKVLKPGKKLSTEAKIKKNSAPSASTSVEVVESDIDSFVNEFPNLIRVHGLTKDKVESQGVVPDDTTVISIAEEADAIDEQDNISLSDLLCTEEMGKKSDDGQDSLTKSPESIQEDDMQEVSGQESRSEEAVNEIESGNNSDAGATDKKDEEEKAKTFKPPTRIYKRPSILGSRKRVRPEPATQAMLKETLRAEVMKMQNDEEDKVEAKKKKKLPKEKKQGAKIVTKIDDSLIKPAIEDFDPANLLDWRDGVGVLPGSNLKFRVNELGLMELVEESDGTDDEMDMDVDDMFKKCENIPVLNKSKPESDGEGVPKKRTRKEKVCSYDTCCCEHCGCYGLAKDFLNDKFCSVICKERFEKKKAAQQKKAAELEAAKERRQAAAAAETSVQLEKLDTSKWVMSSIGSEEGTSEAPLPAPESPEPEDSASNADAESMPADSKPNSERNSPDPSTSVSPVSDQDDEKNNEGYPNDMPWINFNTDRTPNFLWPKYLEFTKTRAAPAKLFEEGGFPERPNGFRAGMKLEGFDPRMQSQFIVLSVVATKGFRVKMHADGTNDSLDFWINADCRDIFPAGHSEKIGKKLVPPKAFAKKFTWAHYVKITNSALAPRSLFAHRQSSKNTIGPSGFRVGMKLEAVDKSNHELVCVATVTEILGLRVLIHFDSWEEIYDYWADPTSPLIHPVGWCEQNGVQLVPPKGVKDFVWDDYLRDTKTQAVPVRAFKPKASPAFKKSMKLECVDPRFPQLIRVGSILEVRDHRLHIGFDNWPLETSTWMDADSPDIHPMGWCNKTGHPLGPPPVPGVEYQCYTAGCRALLKNSQFVLPHMGSCPLSTSNLAKARSLRNKETKLKTIELDKEEEKAAPKAEEPEEEENSIPVEEDDELYVPQVRRKKKAPEVLVRQTGSVRSDVHDSVFRPGYAPSVRNLPVTKATHAKLVNWSNVEGKFDLSLEGIQKWSSEVVSSFAEQVIASKEKSQVFLEENINGNAFLMLSQSDLVELLGFKIGQAVKIYNSILLLKDGN